MELIKITEKNGNKAVSARELHHFLESKRQFSNWIQERIEKYGLIENQDYEVLNNFVKNSDGGRPSIEYILKLDTVKELAMVEGNKKRSSYWKRWSITHYDYTKSNRQRTGFFR